MLEKDTEGTVVFVKEIRLETCRVGRERFKRELKLKTGTVGRAV